MGIVFDWFYLKNVLFLEYKIKKIKIERMEMFWMKIIIKKLIM